MLRVSALRLRPTCTGISSLLLATLVVFAASDVSGCGSSTDDGVAAAPDTGTADTGPSADTRVSADVDLPEVAPVSNCTLDDGTDPVALCLQKVVLDQWHEAAFIATLGVAAHWSSDTFLPEKDASGAVVHDVRDDVGFALSLAHYLQSAARYGDTSMTAKFVADLDAVMTRIDAELDAKTTSKDPDLYRRVRALASSLRALALVTKASKLDLVADAIGSNVFATYHALAPIMPGDASTDADATTDTSADTGTGTDADALDGDALPPIGNGIFGEPGAGGSIVYTSVNVAESGLVALDMVVHHPAVPLDARPSAAAAALAHLHANARESSTGLYYDAIVAKDGASDAPVKTAPFTTETEARVALALARIRELVAANPSLFRQASALPLDVYVAEVLTSLNTTTPALWDAGKKGYVSGLSADLATTSATKTPRDNARLFATIRRAFINKGSVYHPQEQSLKEILTLRTPAYGFLGVLSDQASYLDEVPTSFDLGASPPVQRFSSDANVEALEAFWEQWFGRPS